MKTLSILRLAPVLVVFVGTLAVAEPEIPEPEFSPNATAVDRARAPQIVGNLRDTLAVWRAAGLRERVRVDSITVIASYEGLRVLDLLKILNPDIVNVQAHVEAQYRHFLQSQLSQRIRELEEENGLASGSLTRAWFDVYSRLRYGYGFPNFHEEVLRNPYVMEVYADASESMPSDNAYYGSFPRIELTEHLPLQDKGGKIFLAFLSLITSSPDTVSLYEYLNRSNVGMSHRMVFLPRLTQTPGDEELGEVDETIPSHELGHGMVRAKGEAPRLVDEATADIVAVRKHKTWVIGGKFARDSAIIAKRIRADKPVPKAVEGMLAGLDALAKKGYLRNISDEWTIDHLTRVTRFADNYEAGNPIRYFAYRLLNQLDAKGQHDFEQVALRTVEELAKLPRLTAHNTELMLNVRRVTLELARRKMIEKETARQRDAGVLGKEDQATPGEVVAQAAAKLERDQVAERLRQVRAGAVFERPVIHADYILAEYFRCFAIAAQALGKQHLLPQIRAEAGRVMSAAAEYVDSPAGTSYLVFFRRSAQSSDRTLVAQIAKLFAARETAMSSTSAHADAPAQFELALSAVQEFERTGNAARLENPWPTLERAKLQLARLEGECGETLMGQVDEEDAHGHHH